MKNFFLSVFILSIFLLAFFLESCTLFSGVGSKSSVHKRSNSLVEIAAPVTSSESNYSVAIITDVHFGEEGNRSVDEKFITWLKNFSSGTEPKFIICLGDIGQGGAKSEFDAYNNFVNRVKSVTGIPTYTILGNHD
ncbi:MAG: metallophosphoesterase, partial [Treponema sp.]|nr:metallophosphoesterase [Treponema sp.]